MRPVFRIPERPYRQIFAAELFSPQRRKGLSHARSPEMNCGNSQQAEENTKITEL